MSHPKLNPSVRALMTNPLTVHRLQGRHLPEPPLSFSLPSPPAKLPIDYAEFAEIIRRYTPPNAAFYPDTNFFTGAEKPVELWKSLLERQIVIPPFIWQELQPWLGNPFRNKYIRDRLLDSSVSNPHCVRVDPDKILSDYQRIGALYYIDLLAVRKRRGAILAKEFQTKHGREPGPQEFDRLLQCSVGEQEFHLVRKGRTDIKKATFFADDELVVDAAVDAIVNRRPVTILSSDKDVLEQFVKLMRLFDWHFQAMLFAERFTASPDCFETQPLIRSTAELRDFFADDDGMLIRKPCEPVEFFDWLVPKDQFITPVHCLLFGGDGADLKFTWLYFNAVHDLGRLLETKGKTFGQNTDLFGDKNCHVTGYPVGIRDPRNWIVVARDNVEVVDFMRYPFLDIEHASRERP